jgi:hypothetical protein
LCAFVLSYKLVDLIIAITYAGTGKTYFGDVLVRAHVLIRDLWLRKTKNTVQVATKKGKSFRGIVINRYTLICTDHFQGGFGVGERDVDESFNEKDEVDNNNFNVDEKRDQCHRRSAL